MKITIYTAFNTRHKVSRLFAMGISRFIKAAPEGVECSVHVVISHEESIPLCQEFGFTFTNVPNNYLGKKWNAGLQYIVKNHEFDYVLIMGDDDLISNEAWGQVIPLLQQGYPYVGYNSIYFYSPAYNKARVYAYRDTAATQKLWGCGRFISKQAIEMAAWNITVKFTANYEHGGVRFDKGEEVTLPVYQANYFYGMKVAEVTGTPEFTLWDNTQQKGLDNESEIRLLMNGITPVALHPDKPVMVDIKTAANVWDFTHYISLGEGATVEEATCFLSPEEREYIAQQFADEPVVKLPCREFFIGIRTEQEIITQEYSRIISECYHALTGNTLLDMGAVTLTRHPDHPFYTEAWKNFNKANSRFICGIHREVEGNTIRLHIVKDEGMSKVR